MFQYLTLLHAVQVKVNASIISNNYLFVVRNFKILSFNFLVTMSELLSFKFLMINDYIQFLILME